MMPQQPVFRCLKQCVTLAATSGFALVCNCGETWISFKEEFTQNTVIDYRIPMFTDGQEKFLKALLQQSTPKKLKRRQKCVHLDYLG